MLLVDRRDQLFERDGEEDASPDELKCNLETATEDFLRATNPER
jgi:hypothetical protein